MNPPLFSEVNNLYKTRYVYLIFGNLVEVGNFISNETSHQIYILLVESNHPKSTER